MIKAHGWVGGIGYSLEGDSPPSRENIKRKSGCLVGGNTVGGIGIDYAKINSAMLLQ